MKKSILTLITFAILGTGAVFAQSETSSKDKKTDNCCAQTEKTEKSACQGDCKGLHDMPFPPQGRPDFDKKNGCGKLGQLTSVRHHGNKKNMGKNHKKGNRPHTAPIKSTPKCKCATCVELRKREDMHKQIELLRQEKQKLNQQIDSLRKVMHNGDM